MPKPTKDLWVVSNGYSPIAAGTLQEATQLIALLNKMTMVDHCVGAVGGYAAADTDLRMASVRSLASKQYADAAIQKFREAREAAKDGTPESAADGKDGE